VRDTSTHLDAWAFTAEGKPGADRQQSAKEFHHNQPNWLWRQFVVQDRLNLRDATPRGVRRKSANQPSRQRSCSGTNRDNEHKASE
jgi:hypothetical protein